MAVRYSPPDKVTATASLGAWLTAVFHGLAAALATYFLVAFVLVRDLDGNALIGILASAVSLLVYSIRAAQTRIVASSEHLEVTNLYRTVTARWADINSIDVAIVGRSTPAPRIRLRDGRAVKVLALAGGVFPNGIDAWTKEAKRRIKGDEACKILDEF